MNESLKEGELNREENASRFKVSIPQAIVAAFIIAVCLQIIASFINLPAYFKPEFYHLTLPLSFLVGGGLAVIALIVYVKTSFKAILEHIWQPASIGVLFLSTLFYIFMLPFAEFLTSMIPTEGITWLESFYKQIIQAFEMMLDYKIAGFITVCILAPVLEEILFRGIILRGLLQYGISPIIAITLSSFLFGIAHMNPWQFLGAGLLGAVFGFVYYRTQSLWICIFLHALNNTVSFIMMLRYQSMDENVTNPNDYMSVVICFAIAVLLGWSLYKITKNKFKWN